MARFALVAVAAGLPFILISFEPTTISLLFLTGAAIVVGVLAAVGGEDVLERSFESPPGYGTCGKGMRFRFVLKIGFL